MGSNDIEQGISWLEIVLALLDWPFLVFIGISLFVASFRTQISSLLGRGDIQISWGENRHIKLAELSEGVDEELDPLKEEIQALKYQVADMEAKLALAAGQDQPDNHSPQELSSDDKAAAKERIIKELVNGKYRWRAIETLAGRAAISEEETLDILRAAVTEVVLSKNKSGHLIARYISR